MNTKLINQLMTKLKIDMGRKDVIIVLSDHVFFY